MARDPLSWSLEDEKRRARGRPLTPAEFAVWDQPPPPPRPAPARAPRPGPGFSDVEAAVFDQPARPARPERMPGAPSRGLLRDMGAGYDVAGIPGAIAGAAGQRPVAPPRAPTAPSRPTFDNVQSSATATQTDLSDPRLGLTRITRMPDGSFTDMAAPGVGEERYYDRTGMRADVGAYGNSYGAGDANVSGPDAVRAYNRAEAASALDMSDPANQRLVAERGTRGLARSEAMLQEGTDRAARRAELDLTPELRTARDIAMAEQLGLDRRSQAEISAQLSIAGAEQGTAQQKAAAEAAKVLRDRQIYERELMRKDPEAFAMEQLALLENLPPEERMARLANPKDEIGGALRAAVRRAAANKLGDNNFTPGAAQRTGGMRRFLHPLVTFGQSAPEYTADDSFFSPMFDPSDIVPGLTAEDFEVLMGADRAAYERR